MFILRFPDVKRLALFFPAPYILSSNAVVVNFAFYPIGVDKIKYQSSSGAGVIDLFFPLTLSLSNSFCPKGLYFFSDFYLTFV